jgi:hypothetical protein
LTTVSIPRPTRTVKRPTTGGRRITGGDFDIDRADAAEMFARGYRVEAWLAGHFKVVGPLSTGRAYYILDATGDRCECPSSHNCKHLRCLVDLIRLTADEHFLAGRVAQGLALLQAWGDITAAWAAR